MAVKWGCVGPGRISSDFFLAMKDNLSGQDHEMVAVASRDMTRAQTFAEEFNFKRAYGSYDDLTKDEEVEVVYIGTINLSHVELSIKMLEAGKHVLCETPMAVSLEGAKRVFEAARRNTRIFMEGHWSKFTPAYVQIRKELTEGTLGEIRLVQANACLKVSTIPGVGEGALDLGVYPLSLSCMVFKEAPVKIQATALLNDSRDMDIGGSVILTYKDGGMASLTYHEDTDFGSTSACIMGTKGAIEIQTNMFGPSEIATPTGKYTYPEKPGKYNYTTGLHYEAIAMRDTIKKGELENTVHTMADSEMVMSIVDEIRRQIGLVKPTFE